MTTSSMSTSTAPDQGSQTQGPGGSSNGSGAEQARQVAGTAGQEAKNVARDVTEQARGLLAETRNQVEDQSRTQRDRLVETIRSFSDDLEGMAQERGGIAADAAREVSQRARSLGQRLDGREPSELLDDLRSFARRRPGMFLAGAAISGVVVGRILRGTRDAASGSDTTGGTGGTGGTAGMTQTGERPLTSYDPTPVSPTVVTAPEEAPYPPEGAGTTAFPPVGPAVTTPTDPIQTGRPVEGP